MRGKTSVGSERLRHSALIIALSFSVAAAAACGGSFTTPSGASAGRTGATITGTLASSNGSAQSTLAVASAMTVSVVGTSISVSIDGSGHFVLTGVPGGDIQLHFKGSGVDATTTLPAVQTTESITITVTVSGSNAVIDSDTREDDGSSDGNSQLQLEGRIDAVPPVTAAGTFDIGGTIVETSASTTFVNGGATASFADLVPGIRVHVSGSADGTKLRATRVDIQNTDATLPIVVNGTVSAFTGTAAAFQFTVDGTIVKGGTATSFTGSSAFSDLANGKRVEVKAAPGNGFVTATSIHVNPN